MLRSFRGKQEVWVPRRSEFDAHGFRRLLLVSAVVLLCAALSGTVLAEEQRTQDTGQPDERISAIVRCLKQSREAVLFPADDIQCIEPRRGAKALDRRGVLLPQSVNAKAVCEQNKAAPGADKRILERFAIKEVAAAAKQQRIDTNGIRIIGAVFCNGIDLVGLDIPYSLVLDRSVVWGWNEEDPSVLWGNIEARNMRVGGDLSLDQSWIYGNVRIVRSEISGSFWAGKAFVNHITVENSTIKERS